MEIAKLVLDQPRLLGFGANLVRQNTKEFAARSAGAVREALALLPSEAILAGLHDPERRRAIVASLQLLQQQKEDAEARGAEARQLATADALELQDVQAR